LGLHITREEARRVLVSYHFTPTDIAGVFSRLGTIQYDPLNPVGRNTDLVLQARVRKYRIDDWQDYAYGLRRAYDAWDKQACLVPVSDWSWRAYARMHYRPWHDSGVLADHPQAARAALDEIDRRGPMSSLEFEDRSCIGAPQSWLGPTRIKRILRALWCDGTLVTHHRTGGRHYYERAERVIPSADFGTAAVLDAVAYHRWIVERRVRAAGLLRLGSEQAIWSACGDGATRARTIAELAESGVLTALRVGDDGATYYAPGDLLSKPLGAPHDGRLLFLGPLDSLLWDRKMVQRIFDFDYVWEVYKPERKRRWGYYVLPILHGDRLVGRCEARLDGQTLVFARWWWEDGIERSNDLADALSNAVSQFVQYAKADSVQVGDTVDAWTSDAILVALSHPQTIVDHASGH
jgi:uncharacterized protein YcaQ